MNKQNPASFQATDREFNSDRNIDPWHGNIQLVKNNSPQPASESMTGNRSRQALPLSFARIRSGGLSVFLKQRPLLVLLLLFLSIDLSSPHRVDAKSASEVYELASKSVVVVYNLDGQGNRQHFASGVVMTEGEVATNYHVIEKAAKLAVVYNGKAFTARLRNSDPEMDISVLDVPGLKAPKAFIGKTNQLRIGARVYAIGAPRGLELTLSDGIVSGFREVEGGHYIQTTTPISSGSSGGGLFDEEGMLVGFPTFYLTEGQQLNFAVPVEWVLKLPLRKNANATSNQNHTSWH